MSSEETTGQIPNAVLGEAWSEYCYPQTAEGPYAPRFKRAMAVVNQWLAGRVVVDLPEPDADGAYWAGDYALRPGVQYGEPAVAVLFRASWLSGVDPALSRHLAAALLAAADAAERLSGEVRNGQ